MLLIKGNYELRQKHVSSDTISEFEEIILSDSMATIVKQPSHLKLKFLNLIYRLGIKFGLSTILATKKKNLDAPSGDRKHLFTVMMGLDEAKYKPFGFSTNHCRSIFLFDAWERDYKTIVDFINKYRIDFVFVTASQSAEKLNNLIKNSRVFWIPEGIKKEDYTFKDYSEKGTDVLAVGRKYDDYHNLIKDFLENSGKKYLYEKVKGEIIFPTREEFIAGLADSKISICIPSSITHPERAGAVETMTIRYLQSMLAKCLIVGHAPAEMIELFGYNPVIEIDYNRPAEQLKEIFDNYESYFPLIEKNFKNVVENHTWEHRWKQIKLIFKHLSEK